LIDLGARELPIQPDVVGRSLALEAHQRIKLRGPDPLRIELQDSGQ
jgi:pyrimidine operon attenuation protein/uracil phosphoribosyltransferase